MILCEGEVKYALAFISTIRTSQMKLKAVLFLALLFGAIHGSSLKGEFVNRVWHGDAKEFLAELAKDCKIYNTRIYDACYSFSLNRAVFSVYKVDWQSYEVNIEKRPQFRSFLGIEAQDGTEYKGTAYDRGHLAFDAAFDYDPDILDLTYLLELNIVPMSRAVNRNQWSRVEKKILDLGQKHYEVLVIDIATPSNFNLGTSNINIPAYLYKIINYGGTLECYRFNNIAPLLNKPPYEIDCSKLREGINEHE